MEMTVNRSKLAALLAVAVVVMASCTCVANEMIEENEPDEEAFTGVFLTGMILGAALGASIMVGYYTVEINKLKAEIESLQEMARVNEANSEADSIQKTLAASTNAMENYNVLWPLTSEHWTRQAEMAAYTLWADGKTYSSTDVMETSNMYLNNTVMLANATAQVNTDFNQLSANIAVWNTVSVLANEMEVYVKTTSSEVSSRSTFDAKILTVADTTSDSMSSGGYIYIQSDILDAESYIQGNNKGGYTVMPGTIYSVLGDATLVSEDGSKSYTLTEGRNTVSATAGESSVVIPSGIYHVSEGSVLAGDCISEAFGKVSTLSVTSGMVYDLGSLYLAKYLSDGTIMIFHEGDVDSQGNPNVESSSDLLIGVRGLDVTDADSRNPDPLSVTGLLEQYRLLQTSENTVSQNANNAARAIWGVYDEAKESSAWVTTLAVVNNYKSVTLSSQMTEAMTLSATQQMALWYQSNEGNMSGITYKVADGTDGGNVPLVRGSVYNSQGQCLYSDIILTPLVQTEDTTITKNVAYTIPGYATAMVWSSGESLSTWYTSGGTSTDPVIISLSDGDYIVPTDLGVVKSSELELTDSIPLDVKKVTYVQAQDLYKKQQDDQHNGVTSSENTLFMVVMILAGVLVAYVGHTRQSVLLTVLGAAVAVVGFLWSGTVYDLVTGEKSLSDLARGWFSGGVL